MAYIYALDPATPVGGEAASLGDDRIREVKNALIERLESFFSDADNDPLQVKAGATFLGNFTQTAGLARTYGLETGRGVAGATVGDLYVDPATNAIYFGRQSATAGDFTITTWRDRIGSVLGTVNHSTGRFAWNYSMSVASTQIFYIDGGGDTYLFEPVANRLNVVVGASTILQVNPDWLALLATAKLYLDSAGDTYLWESAANTVNLVVGGNATFRGLTAGAGVPSGYFFVAATARLYFDGVGDTYIFESAANELDIVTGGVANARFRTDGLIYNQHIYMQPTKRLYLDGGTDTYLLESSANHIGFVTGGVASFTVGATYVIVSSSSRVYLDGGGDTYLLETSANFVQLVVGGTPRISVGTTQADFAVAVTIPASQRIYFDGGGDTYIVETGANVLDCYVGGSMIFRFGDTAGSVQFPSIGTTASGANAFLDSGASNKLLRSTSSQRYKQDIREMPYEDAAKIVFGARASWYRSKMARDGDRRFAGFIAEQEHLVSPEFIHFDGEGSPDAVMYERYVVPLTVVVKRQQAEIDALKKQLGLTS